jgi:hypothetical protein
VFFSTAALGISLGKSRPGVICWLSSTLDLQPATPMLYPKSPNSGNHQDSGPYACEDARRLMEIFSQAVQELLELRKQQFVFVAKGNLGAARFEPLIDEANERKQNAKYALLAHISQHGCSSQQLAQEGTRSQGGLAS